MSTAFGQEAFGQFDRLHEQFSYGYDAAWNLRQRTSYGLLDTFGVNELNELTNVTATPLPVPIVAGRTTMPATNVTVNGLAATLYDDNTFVVTNLTLTNGVNTLTAVAHDANGRLDTSSIQVNWAGSANFTYDLNGNMLSDGTRNFAYDDENQLTSVWVTNVWRQDFVYDGLMRKRIERDYTWANGAWLQTSERRYIYDGFVVLQERDANNLPLTTYTRGTDLSGSLQGAGGIGGLLARSDRESIIPAIVCIGNPHPQYVSSAYYHSDGRGNVTSLVYPNGEPVAQYEYDPFGNLLTMSGPLASANRYRFSSKEWDDAAGLYYYGFRFYDPNLQRWPNRDPLGEPGFETLHLVTQPLFIRKLRLNINDSEMQYFVAMAVQSGSINMGDYVRNANAFFTGNRISGLEFFDFLRSGRSNFAPNWPVELLEGPSLFQFVGNNPLNSVDPSGLWWGYIPTSGEEWWDWFKAWGQFIAEPFEYLNMANDTLNCGLGMYGIATNTIPAHIWENNPTNSPPLHAG